MVTISRNEAFNSCLLEWHAEKNLVEERIAFLEKRYGMTLVKFADKSVVDEESFEGYDDLIEWKAYSATLEDLVRRIHEVESGAAAVA